MAGDTKPKAPRPLGSIEAAAEYLRLERQLAQSAHDIRTTGPKAESLGNHLETFVRGVGALGERIVLGNPGLLAAHTKKVLVAYDLGGYNPRARIGAYVDMEASNTFTAKIATDLLKKVVAEARAKESFALLRGGVPIKVKEEVPGILNIRIMDACDASIKGMPYAENPEGIAKKAETAASIRDTFIENAKALGSRVIEEQEGELW